MNSTGGRDRLTGTPFAVAHLENSIQLRLNETAEQDYGASKDNRRSQTISNENLGRRVTSANSSFGAGSIDSKG